ncbi:DNA translocase FtsK [Bacteroidia bacterium]|nr:DNA translocase FtsK [Bacteroidia bacterium]GHV43296.1 DNA translocase FtsK [Bacteroidia bacterium]
MAAKHSNDGKNFFGTLRVFFSDDRLHFIIGLIIFLTVIYLFFAFVSYFFTGAADQSVINGDNMNGSRTQIQNWTSVMGAVIAEKFLNQWFGISSFCILAFLTIVAFWLMHARFYPVWKTFLHATFWTVWLSVFLGFTTSPLLGDKLFFALGGQHGNFVSRWLVSYIGYIGTAFFLGGLLILYFIIASKKTIPFIKNLCKNIFKRKNKNTSYHTNNQDDDLSVRIGDDLVPEEWINRSEEDDENEDEGFEIVRGGDDDEQNHGFEILNEQIDNIGFEVQKPENHLVNNNENIKFDVKQGNDSEDTDPNYNLEKLGKYDPTLDLSHYKRPTLDLLKIYDSENNLSIDMDEQNANKKRIITTLLNYGVEIDSIKATVGPTITLYEIVPKAGVRISKIRNLESDIMLSLAATGIRIIAPIPGKGTIGIEVPNNAPQVVSMHSVAASKKFQESTFELPVVFGKTITNEVFMVDLTKMPHLLVAGATGQGKSVGLNAIITSLLYKKHPSELKLVLVDPKKVEFNIYADIEKHFLAKLPDGNEAIITDTSKVVQTLNSLCKEMDDRYDLLKKAHTRNLKEYNEKFINRQLNPEKGHRFLPYIVVIVDEFGDLIMTAGKEVEMPIARIAQLARAVGMHMIIATQRPSVNIITGIIKANFPARVAFRVSSMMDSRTILDAPGANQLVGRGDMLFSQGNDLTRVQCAFVDTPEVEKIVHYIYGQQGYPTAFYLPEYTGGEGEAINADAVDLNKRDPMFEEAARLVVASQQGSTSLIQRKFSIGYNRAGRLMDQLEVAGIVGATQGSKPRDVLVLDDYHLEQLLQRLP